MKLSKNGRAGGREPRKLCGRPSKPVGQTGKTLLRLRLSHGLTQEQAASLLGIHRTTLNRWERGQEVPHPMTLKGAIALLASLKT